MSRRLSLDGLVGTSLGTLTVRRSSRVHKGSKRVETLHDAQLKIKELQHSLDKNIHDIVIDRDDNIGDEGPNINQCDGADSKTSFCKRNKTFHKLFEDIPEEEMLTETFTCSLQKEVLYHGKLFVSDDHICFHSSVLLKATKVIISTSSVCEVKRHKSALHPSMLHIHTVSGDKYHLMYVKNSTQCYDLLKSVCLHVEEESVNGSPQMSSAENGNGNGNGMMSSYSSNEESAHSRNNSISRHHSLSDTGENTATHEDSMLWKEEEETHTEGPGPKSGPLSQGIADKTTSPPKRNDRTFYVIFYMFCLLLLLLFVSGYIGLRIRALGEQLATLGDACL